MYIHIYKKKTTDNTALYFLVSGAAILRFSFWFLMNKIAFSALVLVAVLELFLLNYLFSCYSQACAGEDCVWTKLNPLDSNNCFMMLVINLSVPTWRILLFFFFPIWKEKVSSEYLLSHKNTACGSWWMRGAAQLGPLIAAIQGVHPGEPWVPPQHSTSIRG